MGHKELLPEPDLEDRKKAKPAKPATEVAFRENNLFRQSYFFRFSNTFFSTLLRPINCQSLTFSPLTGDTRPDQCQGTADGRNGESEPGYFSFNAIAHKFKHVKRYRVIFLTGPPLKMSLDWPPQICLVWPPQNFLSV